jgi:hypothetical protein
MWHHAAMEPMSRSRPPGYGRLISAVKQFSPYALLPLIAKHSAQYDQLNTPADLQTRAPWAYSALARESLLYGRLDSKAEPTPKSLQRLYNLFNEAYNELGGASLSSVITPIFHEQFPYQYNELGRTQAIFGGSTPGPIIPWEEELGVSITDALKGALLLRVWVAKNEGRFEPEILDMAHFQDVFKGVAPRSVIEQFVRLATTTVERERKDLQLRPEVPPAARRYAFNPLVKTPFVDLGTRGLWAPQSALVDLTMTVGNLYHRGYVRWRPSFTKDLGALVEAYVGRQIKSVKYGVVHPEIAYKKGEKKSIDWIWVTPAVVILIECKSGREPLDVKAGHELATATVKRYLGRAREQIDETAERIEENHPAFVHIPSDRPMISLTITAESFYLGNSSLSEYSVPGKVPNRVLSLSEFEHLVTYRPEAIIEVLSRFVSDAIDRPWTMAQALKGHDKLGRNVIIEEAWREINFVDPTALYRTPAR